MKIRRLLLCALLALVPMAGNAQYYSFGRDPAFTRWSQIETDHFRLIYPSSMDSLARVYLFTMEKWRATVNDPMHIDPPQMPVVLHPYTTLSNGSVSWTPRSVNLITSPDAYSGTPEPWISQLAVHEMRHIAQSSHFTRGFYKPLSFLLGEQAPGLGLALLGNRRLLEGDAVVAETELSYAGRGRHAEFLMYMRSLYIDPDIRQWSWDRVAFGSYRYKKINMYAVGYSLVAAARYVSDDYGFSGEYYDAVAPHLYPVTSIFTKFDNKRFKPWKYYNDVSYALFRDMWLEDLERRGPATPMDTLPVVRQRRYCDYVDVTPVEDSLSRWDGCILAVKSGMDYATQLVAIDAEGRERRISHFSPYASRLSDIAGGRIYWSETVLHNPNGLMDYSEIRYLDLRGGHVGTLTRGTKYFNPATSPDGGMIAAAEYPVGGSTHLVVLSSENGEVLRRVEAPANGQLLESAFCGDEIFCTVIAEKGVGICALSPEGRWREVVPAQGSDIRSLKCRGGDLFFSSDLDGLLNVYCLHLADGMMHRLTNSRCGAGHPTLDADGGTLYWSEFDNTGYRPAKASLDTLQWRISYFGKPFQDKVVTMLDAQRLRSQEEFPVGDSSYFIASAHPSKPYRKVVHGVKVHSWAPVYYNVDRIMSMSMDHLYDLAAVGATAYSQNDLGTVNTMLGYSYHKGFHAGHARLATSLANIELEGSVDVNDRHSVSHVQKDGAVVSEETSHPYVTAKLTADYPINLYKGGWLSAFVPLVQWHFGNDSYSILGEEGRLSSLKFGARYYRMLPVATSQVYPRSGFSVSAYGQLPLSGARFDRLAYLGGYLYLPGFTRIQGFKLELEMQKRFAENGTFLSSSMASLPYGYNHKYPTARPSASYVKGSLSYAIPIWLGDASIPGVIYLKRLQVIPYGQYALDCTFDGSVSDYSSYGADLLVDFNFLRIMVDLSAGVRYSRISPLVPTDSPNCFQLLFGLSL